MGQLKGTQGQLKGTQTFSGAVKGDEAIKGDADLFEAQCVLGPAAGCHRLVCPTCADRLEQGSSTRSPAPRRRPPRHKSGYKPVAPGLVVAS